MESIMKEGTYEPSHRQEYINSLIKEFREVLSREKFDIPENTDGVVVLSGMYDVVDGQVIERSHENEVRIQFAVELWKSHVAKLAGKDKENITDEDVIHFGPKFVVNGDELQLDMMVQVAQEYGVPKDKIVVISCGPRGSGNTKTQFEAMSGDPHFSPKSPLTFITSGYHAPRVARTALKTLPDFNNLEVIGVPIDTLSFDVFKKIKGEIKRIISYSQRGDIAP